MSYTTFTVTVSNPGSGNKYYINGALQATVALANSGTYRFDQSDSSNATHPLVFSSDSGNSTPYTTGVTTVGTPGSAGAYTQIVVATSAPSTLYYYCSNHAGMGGQANVTSNSWGALEWSQGNWGAQSDDSAQATGIQSTFNIGSVTNSGDANITPSGIQLSSSQGASVIRFDANITVSGIQFSSVVGTTGEATIDHTVSVTGSQLASSIGSASGEGIIQVGWGGDTWGENQWGDLSGSEPTIVGQQLTSTLGTLQSVTADANVNAVGQSLTSTQGAAVGGASVDLAITGLLQSISIGSSVVGIGATVTGQSLTSTIGTATVDESTLTGEGWGRGSWGDFAWGDNFSTQISGMQLTSAIGSIASISAGASVDLTGIQLAGSVGQTTLTGDGAVDVSGIQANISAGQISTFSITGNQMTMSTQAVDIEAGGSVTLNVVEHLLQTTIAAVTLDIGVTAIVSGQQITSSIDSVSIQANSDTAVTGLQIASSIGNETAFTDNTVSVTGQELTSSIGNESVVVDHTNLVTGQQLNSSIGQVTQASIYSVSGQQITSSLGEEGVIGDVAVTVTGQSLTSLIGNVNITAWSEIDPGVSNTWAEVDLAA